MDASAELEVRAQLSALFVALTRAKQLDAARALWDWAEEWLDLASGVPYGEELEELIEEDIGDA